MSVSSAHGQRAPLIVFASASGGVGKSAVSLALGQLASRAKIKTCLLEADLQFGDWGFWLGLADAPQDAALPAGLSLHMLSDVLDVYRAPEFPEVAEEASDAVAASLDELIGGYDLAIADTGQYWSGLTGALVCSADLIAVMFDQRPSSLAGAVRVQELLGRMGVVQSRCVYVYNHYGARAKFRASEARKALDTEELVCIPDAKGKPDTFLCRGDIEGLLQGCDSFAQGVEHLARVCLPPLGIVYAPSVSRGMRQGRWQS